MNPGAAYDRTSNPSVRLEPYTRELFDLGATGNEKLRGIYSPIYNQSIVRQYIHAQFTEFAQTYRDRYQDTQHFRELIASAFRRIQFDSSRELKILDIGSGAGNSVFPLLSLCLNSQVIASDLSVELLALLRAALEDQMMAQRCTLLQLNAEHLDFREESFDLIVGASILHHLISPEKTIGACAKILKERGYAIFFEPFQAGHMTLRKIYSLLLEDPRQDMLSPEAREFLRRMIRDWEMRAQLDKSSSILHEIDDKWLFTREFFRDLGRRYGFSECIVYPLYDTPHQFEELTQSYLFHGTGKKGKDILPEWAWQVIRNHEQNLPEMMDELLTNGGIIMGK